MELSLAIILSAFSIVTQTIGFMALVFKAGRVVQRVDDTHASVLELREAIFVPRRVKAAAKRAFRKKDKK